MLPDGACVHRAGQMGLAHCSWALLVLGGLLEMAWVDTGPVLSAKHPQQ